MDATECLVVTFSPDLSSMGVSVPMNCLPAALRDASRVRSGTIVGGMTEPAAILTVRGATLSSKVAQSRPQAVLIDHRV